MRRVRGVGVRWRRSGSRFVCCVEVLECTVLGFVKIHGGGLV